MNWKLLIFFTAIFYETLSAQEYRQQDGLYYELPDSNQVKNKNYFNIDNHIYLPGLEFKYSYLIIKNNDTLLIRVDRLGDTKTPNWTFVRKRDADSLTIYYLSFKILDGYGGLDNLFPDYSQTVIQQNYYSAHSLLFDGTTGMIENKFNIWLHPFRGKYFSVLEFSPFPYIKFPIKQDSSWTWILHDISERWSDKRIIEYYGKQHANYQYRITGKRELKTSFGKKECFVIESTANTSLGITKLKSYFNEEYGFMVLDYFNVDNSKVILNLIEVK